jgi:hypothetical protein
MEMIMRIRFLLLALLVPLSPAAAQQDITLAVASSPADTARSPGPGAPFVAQRLYGTVLPAAVAAGYRPAPFHAAGMVELRQDRELSITGGIVGALLDRRRATPTMALSPGACRRALRRLDGTARPPRYSAHVQHASQRH